MHEEGWAERIFREDDMKPHRNFALCRYVLLCFGLSVEPNTNLAFRCLSCGTNNPRVYPDEGLSLGFV
jgi:hypothetical protein